MADGAPAGGLTIHTVALEGEFSEAKNAACDALTAGAACDGYQVTVTNAGRAGSGFTAVIGEFNLLPAVAKVQIKRSWAVGLDGELGVSKNRKATVRKRANPSRAT